MPRPCRLPILMAAALALLTAVAQGQQLVYDPANNRASDPAVTRIQSRSSQAAPPRRLGSIADEEPLRDPRTLPPPSTQRGLRVALNEPAIPLAKQSPPPPDNLDDPVDSIIKDYRSEAPAGDPEFGDRPLDFPPAPTGSEPPRNEFRATEPPAEDDSQGLETLPRTDAVAHEKANLKTDFYNLCHRCCVPGLFAGASLTMLAPVGESFPAVTLTDLVSHESYVSDGNAGFGAGLRAWAGVQNCNSFGFRASYWTFGNHFTNPDPVVPALLKPATLDAYYLSAQTMDLELLNSFCFGRGFLDISLGARWAQMQRSITAVGYGEVSGSDTPISLYGLANVANSMEGMGFTASIGGRRPFGHCEDPERFTGNCGPGGWSCFWNLRGSVLWSDSAALARTEAHAITKTFGGSTAYNRDSAFACSEDDTLVIGELQIGVAYQTCCQYLPGFLTFRLAFEGQQWGTGSVGARSDSTAYLVGGPPLFGGQASAHALSQAGDLTLLGVTFGVILSF